VSVGASDQEMKPEIKKAKSLTVAKTTILYGKISELFLQMKIPHFCKMGAGKFASSLQHYNCIFNHVKDSLTLTLTGFVLDMIFNTITKTYLLGKKAGNFSLQFWEFYLQLTFRNEYCRSDFVVT